MPWLETGLLVIGVPLVWALGYGALIALTWVIAGFCAEGEDWQQGDQPGFFGQYRGDPHHRQYRGDRLFRHALLLGLILALALPVFVVVEAIPYTRQLSAVCAEHGWLKMATLFAPLKVTAGYWVVFWEMLGMSVFATLVLRGCKLLKWWHMRPSAK